MTRGERAARRFVRDHVLSRVFTVLVGPPQPGYERVLSACRRDMGLADSTHSFAVKRLIAAFPDAERHALTQLLTDVLDVEFDRRRVHEHAGFRVGVVVGLSQAGAMRSPRKAGAR
jgi:hypothetical protein